jgi:hypothetical protein
VNCVVGMKVKSVPDRPHIEQLHAMTGPDRSAFAW